MKRFVWMLVSCCLWMGAAAEPPSMVSFQGKLTDASGVPVADGNYSIRFRIYSAQTGGDGDPCTGPCVWEETQSVATQAGIYSIFLGSSVPLLPALLDGPERYVGVKLATEAEMVPRRRIASTPYALIAANASRVGDVVHSMLDPSTFNALSTGTWVLMDGRSVAGTQYEILTGNSSVPDARGRFLRAKDHGANNNPDGDTNLGTVQQDEFKAHSHTVQYATNTSTASFMSRDGNNFTGNFPTSFTGGAESRPKNVTVNVFVRVD